MGPVCFKVNAKGRMITYVEVHEKCAHAWLTVTLANLSRFFV